MKKILALTAGMLLMASMAFAKELETGTIELSGSSNGFFAISSGDGDTVTILNLGVDGLYYVTPNIGVGGLLDYTKYGSDADGSAFAIGPEVIYDISLAEDVNAYVGANLGYYSNDMGDATNNGLFLGLGGGIKYFFIDSASLNCGLFYSHDFGDVDLNSFGVSFGISVFIK